MIDPITRENLQENIAKKDEADRLKRTQRTFIRKGKVAQGPKREAMDPQGGLKKFFGIKKPDDDFELGLCDENG